MKLNEYLSNLRQSTKLDLRTLGGNIGISPSAIHKIESGATPNPTFATLFLLGKELKADPAEIFFILRGFEPAKAEESGKYITNEIAVNFEKQYQQFPDKGAEVVAKWVSKSYNEFKSDYYKKSPDFFARISDKLTFSKAQVDFLIANQNYFDFSLGYPLDSGESAILDVFYNGGIIIKEDVSGYCQLVEESFKENNKANPPYEVLWGNSKDQSNSMEKVVKKFNNGVVALKKFRNNSFPSQLYVKDILDLDAGFAMHGEVFMMSWQLADNFKKWDYFNGRLLVKNLILIDRWITANCFEERGEWIEEINKFNSMG
jgi:transcriptional regulator with XRE-family HTH domain